MELPLSPEAILDLIVSQPIKVKNSSGGDFAAATLIYLSGVDADGLPLITKADADAGVVAYASHVLVGGIVNGAEGYAFKRSKIQNVNTLGATVSDPVYLSATAGAFTLTRPTGAALIQIVGRVTVVSATVGEIEIDMSNAGGGALAGQIRVGYVAGAAAGNLAVTAQAPSGAGTGPKIGDRLIAVFSEDDTSGVTVALTSEFSITGNDQINNTGGTSTANKHVAVWWQKLTA